MTASLASMGAGFADPVHGAQQTFRCLLDAMSAPGRIHVLPAGAIDGLARDDGTAAPPVEVGMAAVLLTLLDADTPVHLVAGLFQSPLRDYLRFHTGARAAESGVPKGYTVANAQDMHAGLWQELPLGSDEEPQDGATLLVHVQALSSAADPDRPSGVALDLRGPGIEHCRRLSVAGLPVAFWQWRVECQAKTPRGIDIVLVRSTEIAAIPRSSRIELGH